MSEPNDGAIDGMFAVLEGTAGAGGQRIAMAMLVSAVRRLVQG